MPLVGQASQVEIIHGRLRQMKQVIIPADTMATVTGFSESMVRVKFKVDMDGKWKEIEYSFKGTTLEVQKEHGPLLELVIDVYVYVCASRLQLHSFVVLVCLVCSAGQVARVLLCTG